MDPHDSQVRRILTEIQAGRAVSQRSLSRELGIALGSTNLLLRRLIRMGWVRVVRDGNSHFRYVITPDGTAENARMSRVYFDHNLRYYAETRDRIRQALAELSAGWAVDATLGGAARQEKPIVFYRAGRVAEIGYICLFETDLRLIGIVDDDRDAPFFGLEIHRTIDLSASTLRGVPFGRLVVMSFDDAEETWPRLEARAVPREVVCWV